MEKGDISNEMAPALVMVFEGLLATPPLHKRRVLPFTQRGEVKMRRYVEQWELNEPMVHVIMDTVFRRKWAVDILTYMGDDFAAALEDRLDTTGIPYRYVLSFTPDRMARELPFRPDIAAIYDPDPSRRFTYGGKSRLLDPSRPDLFGAF